MTFYRYRRILVIAGCALGMGALLAQDTPSSGGSSSGGGSGGNSSGGNSSGGNSSGGSAPGSSAPGGSFFDIPGAGASSGAATGFGLPGMPGSGPGSANASGSSTGQGGATDAQGQNGQPGQPTQPGTSGPSANPASSFGFPALPTEPTAPATSGPVMPAASLTTTPAATTFGSGTGGAQIPTAAAATFTVPGFYGASSQTFTVGQGRLARPRFLYTGSLQVGYDDNVLSSPTNGLSIAPRYETVLVSPAVPATGILVPTVTPTLAQSHLLYGSPPVGAFAIYVPETIPGHNAVTARKLVFAGAPPAKRVGSLVFRANAGAQIQFASRRTIFTLDANVTGNDYPSRPGKSTDYTGSLGVTYVYKVNARLQFSATVSAAYLTQPNLQIVNAPTRNVGNYYTENAKFDVSYGWTHRFSTVTSVVYNAIGYDTVTEKFADYNSIGFGTEARYLVSPLLTAVSELRYSQLTHPSLPALNSQHVYYLIGAEVTLSRRLTGSLRVGEETGSFTTGQSFSSPYMELAANWRYSPAGVVSLTSRYGFEEPPAADTTLQVFRVGINFSQAFSTRFRMTLGVSGANRVTNYEGLHLKQTEDNLDFNIGLQYTLTRHFTLTANYDYLEDLVSVKGSSYFRNQSFLGAQYTF